MEQAASARTKPLEAFIGEWSIEPDFEGAPPGGGGARTTFEWLAGRTFLVQRWEVPVPEAPDGIAVIGYDAGRRTLLQHYFDSRGVARVYEMGLDGPAWTLERIKPDFSPLDFWQRWDGRFSDDGATIEGRWEMSRDEGATWHHDFNLTYRRVG
jgi:hypothetical protein